MAAPGCRDARCRLAPSVGDVRPLRTTNPPAPLPASPPPCSFFWGEASTASEDGRRGGTDALHAEVEWTSWLPLAAEMLGAGWRHPWATCVRYGRQTPGNSPCLPTSLFVFLGGSVY